MQHFVLLLAVSIFYKCTCLQPEVAKTQPFTSHFFYPSLWNQYSPQAYPAYPLYQQPIINQPALPLSNGFNGYYPWYQSDPYAVYSSPQVLPYPMNTFPQYQQYPQQNFGNIDPLAYIPTEIIDIDAEEGKIKFEWPTSFQSETQELAKPNQAIKTSSTSTVTTKPIKIVATRIFEEGASEPKVDISYTGTNSGSGILVEADRNDNEVDSKTTEKHVIESTTKAEHKSGLSSLFGF